MNTSDYKLILDSLSEGVCVVDRNWEITNFNRAAEELTGVRTDEALSLSFADLFSCDVCECHSLLSGVMESGETINGVSTRISNRKGDSIPVTMNATPLRDPDGNITGLVATFLDNRAIETLRKELRHEFTFGDIVSKNTQILRILDILPHIAESESTVLILGPSGTGKELIARAIHAASPRSENAFVAVNCGALPDTLLESELFGYKKGAFTDAKRDKPGRFAMAEGGTMFLDEIGDLSPAMQVKLLRVLQEKQYEPLGATIPVNANVRILAATNRDLAMLVEDGVFRSDLYYRLNVIELSLPPLSERPEDIPLLVDHFIEMFHAQKGSGPTRISRAALERLLRYDFPGNIRELQNIIERAHVLCPYDEIAEQCLPPQILSPRSRPRSGEPHSRSVNLRRLPSEEEKAIIIETLERFGGHRGKTAAALDIDKSTLWRKMKKHGIGLEDA